MSEANKKANWKNRRGGGKHKREQKRRSGRENLPYSKDVARLKEAVMAYATANPAPQSWKTAELEAYKRKLPGSYTNGQELLKHYVPLKKSYADIKLPSKQSALKRYLQENFIEPENELLLGGTLKRSAAEVCKLIADEEASASQVQKAMKRFMTDFDRRAYSLAMKLEEQTRKLEGDARR